MNENISKESGRRSAEAYRKIYFNIHKYLALQRRKENLMIEYKDLKNKTYLVTQRVLSEEERKIYTEEEILTALFKIFSSKQ